MKKMSLDFWIVVAVLTFLSVWAGLTALRQWSLVQNVQIPRHGYGVIMLGILFSLIVGAGLMALVPQQPV